MAKKKLLIAAFVVGAFAALLLWLYGQQMQEEKKKLMANPKMVVKAARNIKAGTPLRKNMITTEEVPARFLPPNPVLKEEVEIYLGQPLAVNVQEGAMILSSDFSVSEVSRQLSDKIPANERAMSVPVNEVSGISGLLKPGDRVDILGTFPIGSKDQVIPEAGGGESMGYVTMTLLQNVTLLAVGQDISDVQASEPAANRDGYSTVTASVTIDEAELLTIAQTRGNLTLLLRHRDDVEIGSVKRKTLRQVLEDLELLNKRKRERTKRRRKKKKKEPGIEIIRGGN